MISLSPCAAVSALRLFLVILLLALLGFANAFYAILGKEGSGAVDCSTVQDGDLQELCQANEPPGSFATPWRAIRTTLAYVFGDFDLAALDDGPTPVLLSLLWCALMVVLPVLLLNLIIAVLNASYVRLDGCKLAELRLQQTSIMLEMLHGRLKSVLDDHPYVHVLKPAAKPVQGGPADPANGTEAPSGSKAKVSEAQQDYIENMEGYGLLLQEMGEANASRLLQRQRRRRAMKAAQAAKRSNAAPMS
ncbi:hypothetical protein JKP88DRAFT_255888 [Tribonema minus]|uniref:Ion transport domain-containing protein n=1 Tax=Tribonema minus TaxID=303371 RepID=A0A835YQC1_9STRA|nr:hypothetical protein JKP88DRAFT_247960 [Tribonema minus]KAG5182653.1 hypothetical protein JKP88DRAFT_255888 [Tribonema minus]